MRIRSAMAILVFVFSAAALAEDEVEFTSEFRSDCNFTADGGNLYFPLKPGRVVLEGEDDGETFRVQITVTNETAGIFVRGLGVVRTRVIEERETVDGELIEVSRNYFAMCRQTGEVWYFGEDVDIFHEDGSITHDGAWIAGKPDGNGLAEPGVIMPGSFLLGSRYYQELADGIALDRAEHMEMGLDFRSRAGRFRDCVFVIETSPLEPGHESEKTYCPGVGLVADNEARLISYSFRDDDD